VLKASRTHIAKITQCWLKRERSIKRPHNSLASLRAKISEVMADIDREVVIRP
jgi:hypothetical protein